MLSLVGDTMSGETESWKLAIGKQRHEHNREYWADIYTLLKWIVGVIALLSGTSQILPLDLMFPV
jgi:hypothetical protein